jgi:hypothetical protein
MIDPALRLRAYFKGNDAPWRAADRLDMSAKQRQGAQVLVSNYRHKPDKSRSASQKRMARNRCIQTCR